MFGVFADTGRSNGLGAVLFESEEAAANAVEELDRAYIGKRYVELS